MEDHPTGSDDEVESAYRSSRDETHGAVSWRTGLGAIGIAFVLAGAGVAGFILAGRDGGLAKADAVLARLPFDTELVASLDFGRLMARPALLEALVGPGAPALLKRWGFVVPRVRRAYLFADASGRTGTVIAGAKSAKALASAPAAGEYLGVRLRKVRWGTAARVHDGLHVFGPTPIVKAVLMAARGRGKTVAAQTWFPSFRALAKLGRSHQLAQVVLGPAAVSRLARRWAPAAGARLIGAFLREAEGEFELLVALRADESAAKSLPAAVSGIFAAPSGARPGWAPSTVREEGVTLVTGRLSAARVLELCRVSRGWLK